MVLGQKWLLFHDPRTEVKGGSTFKPFRLKFFWELMSWGHLHHSSVFSGGKIPPSLGSRSDLSSAQGQGSGQVFVGWKVCLIDIITQRPWRLTSRPSITLKYMFFECSYPKNCCAFQSRDIWRCLGGWLTDSLSSLCNMFFFYKSWPYASPRTTAHIFIHWRPQIAHPQLCAD